MVKAVIRVKLFKTLLFVIPCLLIAVLVIVAIPRPENYIYDEEGDLEAFDEPTFVTNSDMGFFYKKNQLTTYRKQKQPDKVYNVVMSENIVTTDFTKNEVSILPDVKNSYTESKNVVLWNGGIHEYITKNDKMYTLKGGAEVAAEEAFEIILAEGDDMMNTYSLIECNPEKLSDINTEGAKALIEWMTGDEASALIAKYGEEEYGSALFYLLEE